MRPSIEALARLWAASPFHPSRGAFVLGWHQVDVSGPLAVPPATFARQMELLAERRSEHPVIELDDVPRWLGESPESRHAVVLTFDDAWADNFVHALGPLVEYGLPATLFAPSGLLGTPGYLTREQLVEMSEAGLSVGAHTRTHPDLRSCDAAQLDDEIRGSKEDLEDLLGGPVTSFAYPCGLYDARVVASVAAAGFSTAVTVQRGWWVRSSPMLEVPRSFAADCSDKTFLAAASGGLNALAGLDRLKVALARPA